ncbi:unnamed protein product [Penicillium discolor]
MDSETVCRKQLAGNLRGKVTRPPQRLTVDRHLHAHGVGCPALHLDDAPHVGVPELEPRMPPYRQLLGNDREGLRMQSQLDAIEGAQRPTLARLAQLALFAPLRRQVRVALVRSH